jgi:hypothetical protein
MEGLHNMDIRFNNETYEDLDLNFADLPTPTPSIHPNTRAIYIRNIDRPVLVQHFQERFVALASGPGTPSPDVLVGFHTTTVQGHVFAVFSTKTAAARARAGLHGQRWRQNSSHAMWVDYVPEYSVNLWNAQVERGYRSAPPNYTYWEVLYDLTGGRITAQLAWVPGSHNAIGPTRGLLNRPRAFNFGQYLDELYVHLGLPGRGQAPAQGVDLVCLERG